MLAGADRIANNPADYELANAENCYDADTHHWVTDYSWIDEPVGSLGAHYHTRGAMYYVVRGAGARFNDRLNVSSEAHNDTLGAGELRFVNAGVYYGPEEVLGGEGATYLSSIHEPRPVGRRPRRRRLEHAVPVRVLQAHPRERRALPEAGLGVRARRGRAAVERRQGQRLGAERRRRRRPPQHGSGGERRRRHGEPNTLGTKGEARRRRCRRLHAAGLPVARQRSGLRARCPRQPILPRL